MPLSTQGNALRGTMSIPTRASVLVAQQHVGDEGEDGDDHGEGGPGVDAHGVQVLDGLEDAGGEHLVERHQQQSHAQPAQEGHAHLQVQQVEGDGEAQRHAPQLVEAAEEVDHAVHVRAHQVDHLAQRGARQAAAARLQRFAVHGGHQGAARRQRHLGDLEGEDVLEEGGEQRGAEEPQGAAGAPARRSRRVLHEGHQAAEEQRAREAQRAHRHLQHAEGVVAPPERRVQHAQQAHVALQLQRLLLLAGAPGAAQEVPADRPRPKVAPAARRPPPPGLPALVEVSPNHGGAKLAREVVEVGGSVQLPSPPAEEERREPQVEEPRDAAAPVLGHRVARLRQALTSVTTRKGTVRRTGGSSAAGPRPLPRDERRRAVAAPQWTSQATRAQPSARRSGYRSARRRTPASTPSAANSSAASRAASCRSAQPRGGGAWRRSRLQRSRATEEDPPRHAEVPGAEDGHGGVRQGSEDQAVEARADAPVAPRGERVAPVRVTEGRDQRRRPGGDAHLGSSWWNDVILEDTWGASPTTGSGSGPLVSSPRPLPSFPSPLNAAFSVRVRLRAAHRFLVLISSLRVNRFPQNTQLQTKGRSPLGQVHAMRLFFSPG
ncbi:hypothetical protein EYF80_029350 [Liparis tanakae]|uniref:Uncharacterized protein n=1 Tax=Liparis tanakae TaxID=230148 RepID=A0A4Z2H419_9TELE|nr:hypothetical protein EYF80_029350 [Liparis tanakae]